MKVRFITKASIEQIRFGGNDNPNELLELGEIYEVKEKLVHSHHTKLILKDFPDKKFNSVNFRELTTKEIFKLQRPVAYGNNEILLYNKDRSSWSQFPMDKALKKLFGKKFKIFVLGYIGKDTLLHIEKVVKDEDW